MSRQVDIADDDADDAHIIIIIYWYEVSSTQASLKLWAKAVSSRANLKVESLTLSMRT